GRLREGLHDNEGAESLYRQAAAHGATDALNDLTRVMEESGNPLGADDVRRFGLDVDGNPMTSWESA
ncbi:MAG: hypothetical protein ABW046_14150, partial [Actinoplanes sp.]